MPRYPDAFAVRRTGRNSDREGTRLPFPRPRIHRGQGDRALGPMQHLVQRDQDVPLHIVASPGTVGLPVGLLGKPFLISEPMKLRPAPATKELLEKVAESGAVKVELLGVTMALPLRAASASISTATT